MGYTERTDELLRRYAFFLPNLPEADYNAIKDRLTAWGAQRENGLKDLASILADQGDSPIADKYKSQLSSTSMMTLAGLQNLLEVTKVKNQNLEAFRDIAAAEEDRFWSGLASTKAGESRDEQLRLCQALEKYARDLDDRWSRLSGDEKALLEREKYIADRLRVGTKEALQAAVDAHVQLANDAAKALNSPEILKRYINDGYQDGLKKIGSLFGISDEKVKKFLEKLDRNKSNIEQAAKEAGMDTTETSQVYGYLTKPGSALVTAIWAGLTTAVGATFTAPAQLAAKAGKYLDPITTGWVNSEAQSIRDTMSQRQTIIVSYSTVRREADDYVRNNGYDTAKTTYNNGKRAFDDWQNNQRDGLQASAQTLGAQAESGRSYLLERMNKANQAFVKKWSGILIDQVSSDTVKILSEEPYWKEWGNDTDQFDMDGKLKQMYAGIWDLHGNIDNCFGSMTTFNDLPLESQALLQELVKKLDAEHKQPLTAQMKEALKKLQDAQAKQPQSALAEAKRQAQKLAETVTKG